MLDALAAQRTWRSPEQSRAAAVTMWGRLFRSLWFVRELFWPLEQRTCWSEVHNCVQTKQPPLSGSYRWVFVTCTWERKWKQPKRSFWILILKQRFTGTTLLVLWCLFVFSCLCDVSNIKSEFYLESTDHFNCANRKLILRHSCLMIDEIYNEQTLYAPIDL